METRLKFATKRSKVEHCPCGKSNRDGKFAPFDGFENKGHCHSCGNTFFPDQYQNVPEYYQNSRKPQIPEPLPEPNKNKIEAKVIDNEIVRRSMQGYEANIFVQGLVDRYGEEVTGRLIVDFFLGTSKSGGVVYWLIDENMKVRSAKEMIYNSDLHRDRFKTPRHLFKKGDGYEPCLFGLHRLKKVDPETVLCLTESEKGALIGSIHYPEYLWIATGGSNGLTRSKAYPIRGRDVIVFPDCDDPGRKGLNKTIEILQGLMCNVRVCDIDPELNDGTDVADVLLNEPLINNVPAEELPITEPPYTEPAHTKVVVDNGQKPEVWIPDTSEMESFFAGIKAPGTPVKLNSCSTITDVLKFVDSHLSIVKGNYRRRVKEPYLERLNELKEILTN